MNTRRSILAVLAATLGALAFTAAPALAAGAPETPTLEVEGIKATEATFHGVLNPAASEPPSEVGTYQFVYRPSKAPEKACRGAGEKLAPESPGMPAGQPAEPVFETVTGLSAGTEYAVCLLAENGAGKATSTPVRAHARIPRSAHGNSPGLAALVA